LIVHIANLTAVGGSDAATSIIRQKLTSTNTLEKEEAESGQLGAWQFAGENRYGSSTSLLIPGRSAAKHQMISGKKNEDSESGQETACGDLDEEEAGIHREQFSREW
jgi:hypothetical protein